MGLYVRLRLAPNTLVVADFVAPSTNGDQAPASFAFIQPFGPARNLDWHATWVAVYTVSARSFPPK